MLLWYYCAIGATLCLSLIDAKPAKAKKSDVLQNTLQNAQNGIAIGFPKPDANGKTPDKPAQVVVFRNNTKPEHTTPAWPKDFMYSSSGKPVKCNCTCINVNEPADRHNWDDNYLCFHKKKTVPSIEWSHRGPIKGMKCTHIYEPQDPDSWQNNYICVPKKSPYYFMWSNSGPVKIKDVSCLKIDEPSEAAYWRDNYLCAYNSKEEAHKSQPINIID